MASNYPTEVDKTISSGVSTSVNGKQKYYILEYLVSSSYHQAGEKQEVMSDEVILGRDEDCHIRFDESFSTVSRHHASIIRDGDNWRLVQLSKTNTTFLNGKPLQDSWYLQSGDEIQLAVNGPKLIFKIPTETAEFKLGQRLDSFKEQVIRPYKATIIVICCVIALLIAGGIIAGVVIKKQNDNLNEAQLIINEQREQINALFEQVEETNNRLAEEAAKADEAQKKAIKAQSAVFKERAERIKSQENLEEVQTQMQQLRDEMNSFYYGIINGENQ